MAENVSLLDKIKKQIEKQDSIDRTKAEKARRQEILVAKGMFVEHFNETVIDKNNKIIIKRKTYGNTN